MPHRSDAASVVLAATQARRLRLTQSAIAEALGASQSQVSRILSGATSPSSKLAADICEYVSQGSKVVSRHAVASNDDLMNALTSVWDGSPAHARALATVIRSLGILGATTHPDRIKP